MALALAVVLILLQVLPVSRKSREEMVKRQATN